MKDLGELNYYLGMKITRSEEYIKLDQSGYVREILEKYSHLLRGMEGKTVNTPMERDLKLRNSKRGLCRRTNKHTLLSSHTRILSEHYSIWHSIQDQTSHMQGW